MTEPPPDLLPRGHTRSTLRTFLNRFGPALGLVAVFLYFQHLEPKMGTPGTVEEIARQTVIVGTAAVGMTLVIISAGIDLSVGSLIAFSSVVIASLMKDMGVSPLVAACGGILAGAACGMITSVLITRLGIVPFIVTLGGMSIIRGAAKRIAHSRTINLTPTWISDLLDIGGPAGEMTCPSQIVGNTMKMVFVLAVLAVLASALVRQWRRGRARGVGVRLGWCALSAVIATGGLAGADWFFRLGDLQDLLAVGEAGTEWTMPVLAVLELVCVVAGAYLCIWLWGKARHRPMAVRATIAVVPAIALAAGAVYHAWYTGLTDLAVQGPAREWTGPVLVLLYGAKIILGLAGAFAAVSSVARLWRSTRDGLPVLEAELQLGAAFCRRRRIARPVWSALAAFHDAALRFVRHHPNPLRIALCALLAEIWLGGLAVVVWYTWYWAAGIWVMGLFALIMALLLRYTRLGRHVFAVGSNEQTARLCGVGVARVKMFVYTMSGAAAGLAGLMLVSYQDQGDPTGAAGFELDVIASVIIGGGSFSGGEGSIFGTLIGAAIMKVIRVGCDMMGWPPYITQIVTGSIIIIAVALDRLRHRGTT